MSDDGERVAAATTAARLKSPRAKHRQPWPVDSALSVMIARRDQPRSNRWTLDAMHRPGGQTDREDRHRKKRTRGKRREEGVASRRTLQYERRLVREARREIEADPNLDSLLVGL